MLTLKTDHRYWPRWAQAGPPASLFVVLLWPFSVPLRARTTCIKPRTPASCSWELRLDPGTAEWMRLAISSPV